MIFCAFAALQAQSVYSTLLTVTTFAGTANSLGSTDATGSAARFYRPHGVATDGSGNVYVADSLNHTIRKITAAGVVTTVAGLAGSSGSTDDVGSAARFNQPTGVAVDGLGNIYVADLGNRTVRKITSGGVVSTFAGAAGDFGTPYSTGASARFYSPIGVAVDVSGNIYVVDAGYNTIRKITPAGLVMPFAGIPGTSGSTDGSGTGQAKFNFPVGIAVDGSSNVYVADYFNSKIRKITPNGDVTTIAGTAGSNGSTDGTGTAALFYYPRGLTVDGSGNVYVADSYNYTIRRITPAGVVTTLAGLAGYFGQANGTGSVARFGTPMGMAMDGTGNFYIADYDSHTIRKGVLPVPMIVAPPVSRTVVATYPVTFTATASGSPAPTFQWQKNGVDIPGATAATYTIASVSAGDAGSYTAIATNAAGTATSLAATLTVNPAQTFMTFAGSAGNSGSIDGAGTAAKFYGPCGIAVNGSGYTYVADTNNRTIRKITPTGDVTTFAGLVGGQQISTDGTGSAARFYLPYGVALDGAGNIYVGDLVDPVIRKITPSGTVTTLAGSSGNVGSADGTGSAAQFNVPWFVAADSSGNVYVTERDNHTVRKITPAGVVTTLAGSAGNTGSADGSGTAARFNKPSGVAVDQQGNVYVSDTLNSTIRKISSTGDVTTLAGLAGHGGSADGTGSAARFLDVRGLAVDWTGNVYAAEFSNRTIRKITPAGIVTTLGGFTAAMGSTDGIGSAARFNRPLGIAVDLVGNVYVTDASDYTIRLGYMPSAPAITVQPIGQTGVATYGTTLTATATGNPRVSYQWRKDGVDISGATGASYTIGSLVSADAGSYTVVVTNAVGSVTSSAATLAVNAPYAFSTYAGFPATGTADGVGTAAQFNSPQGVATDSSGNIYVADSRNHAIRKITPAGVVTTLAGKAGSSGTADGVGSVARFNSPSAIAVDGSGNAYVADTENYTVRKISSGGVVSTLAGSPGVQGNTDGVGSNALFTGGVSGIAVDVAGNVYVTVWRVVRKITPSGVVTTLAGDLNGGGGSTDGAGTAARFGFARGAAVDGAGNIYVADSDNYTIRKITSAGVVTTFAGMAGVSDRTDGTGTAARFFYPHDVSVDSSGNIFVVDDIVIRMITSSGEVSTLVGSTTYSNVPIDGIGSAARFVWPVSVAVDATGNLYVADNNTVRKITSGLVVTTLAGTNFSQGSMDGAGNAARFNYPWGVALDGLGNLYVADVGNATIRKITANGTVTTLAGLAGQKGSADGTGSSARFDTPMYVATDGLGNVYVSDYNKNTIRKITSAGVVTTLAGATDGSSGSADGVGSAARFSAPQGLGVDGAGNVYVVDSNNSTIRKITAAGVVTTFAGTLGVGGSLDGVGTAAQFNYPTELAVDGAGNVYVADTWSAKIRKITSAGVVTTLAGGYWGSADGAGSAAQFSGIYGIAVDGVGSLYVTDMFNNTVRKVTSAGVVTTIAGKVGNTGSADGTGPDARFNSTYGIAVDGSGNLYVSDAGNNTIRRGVTVPVFASAPTGSGTFGQSFSQTVLFSGTPSNYSASGLPPGLSINSTTGEISGIPSVTGLFTVTLGATNGAGSATATLTLTIAKAVATLSLDDLNATYDGLAKSVTVRQGIVTTLAGTVGLTGDSDGTGTAAKFNIPRGVGVDGNGNVYVADQYNYTVRKITAAGAVTTFAGSSGNPGTADGTGSTARFGNLQGVAVDNAGNVYVAEQVQSTIRKITPAGIVTTLAGKAGTPGYADGTGSAALFRSPNGVTVDASGNVYVSEVENQTIRKITPGGVVTTVAGSPGVAGSSDGTGTAARFNQPFGLAVDSGGNLYVADTSNHTIRKITPGGAVTTLAGAAGSSGIGDGTGAAARFFFPQSVAVDSFGNVYVGDASNTIRKITPGGVVTTLAGTPGSAGSNDGHCFLAKFNDPTFVTVDNIGNIYVADTLNFTIRKISQLNQTGTLSVTYNGSTTAPTAAGSYTVVATLNDSNYQGSTTGTLIISKSDQAALSVNSSASGTFGTPYTATATGGSGTGALAWSLGAGSTAPGAAIDSSTGSVTSTGAGTVVIKVTKASDTNFLSATSADFTVTFGKATATVTLGSQSANYDGSTHVATATTVPASLVVTFTYEGSPAAPTNAGTYTVIGTVSDANYQGSASALLTITKATPTITWATPSPIFFGTALSGAQLNASANTAGTFLYNPGAGEIRAAGIQTLSVSFTPADTTNYNGASAQQFLVVNVPGGAPLFVTQPTSQSVPIGSSHTLTALAIGVPDPTYQWRKDGVNINGATGSSYTIANVAAIDGGSYTVVATNSVAAQASNVAVLTPYVAAPSDAVISIAIE